MTLVAGEELVARVLAYGPFAPQLQKQTLIDTTSNDDRLGGTLYILSLWASRAHIGSPGLHAAYLLKRSKHANGA